MPKGKRTGAAPQIDAQIVDQKSILLPHESATGDARAIFLETLAMVVPEILSVLQRDVLPMFQTISEEVWKQTDSGPETLRSFTHTPPSFVRLPDILLWRNLDKHAHVKEVAATKEALWSWAKGYDLNAEWFLDACLQTLANWRVPEAEVGSAGDWLFGDELHFYTVPMVERSLGVENQIEYQHAAWAEGEAWPDYEKRELAGFRRHLANHRECRLMSGYTLPPSIENYEHFAWVALAYCKRAKPNEILELYNKHPRLSHILPEIRYQAPQTDKDDSTVRKAVREKAALLGLPRLRIKVGRPRNPSPGENPELT